VKGFVQSLWKIPPRTQLGNVALLLDPGRDPHVKQSLSPVELDSQSEQSGHGLSTASNADKEAISGVLVNLQDSACLLHEFDRGFRGVHIAVGSNGYWVNPGNAVMSGQMLNQQFVALPDISISGHQ